MSISKNFERLEFACKCGCGFDTVDITLLRVLQDVRNHFDKPILITSACRCKDHNEAVGGSPKSQHLLGRAADIQIHGVDPSQVYDYLKDNQFISIGNYKTFTHIDSRTDSPKRWEG